MARVLTAAAVEKVRPDPQKRIELPDGLLPGLYLVIQPSGKKSWAARYRAAGKTRKPDAVLRGGADLMARLARGEDLFPAVASCAFADPQAATNATKSTANKRSTSA